MRKFTRVGPPPVWVENEAKWNQQWVELLKQNANAAFRWYMHGGQTAREIALPHLKKQTDEHCSFCDGFPVEGVSLDTIEHFRPKSAFPQHAYSWSNLYYCCNACQAQKGEEWDERLIAPDEPDYLFYRYFEFDFTTGAMRPSTNATEAEKQRAEVTIAMYGLDTNARRLNRRLKLREWSSPGRAEVPLNEVAYRDYLEPAAGKIASP